MEKGLWDGAYMRILLNGKWHVVLEDGTTGQMDLPGTLDENGIGHRDVGAKSVASGCGTGECGGRDRQRCTDRYEIYQAAYL